MESETEHVSLDALNELKDIMEDEFELLVETFINDSMVRLENIAIALTNENPEGLRVAAHSFKGSSSNIYALALTEMCKELETIGLEGHTENAQVVFEKVKEEFTAVKSALQKVIG